MNSGTREFWPGLEAASEWISANARETEKNGQGLALEMGRLHQEGLLIGCLPITFGGSGLGQDCENTVKTFEILRRLGRASLPVARLFEGHMNAVKLVSLYGNVEIKSEVFGAILGGALMGVWGADSPRPVTFRLQPDNTAILTGGKDFASGLGCITHAIVTAKSADEDAAVRLFVVEVSDKARQDPSTWTAAGMKATLSGHFNFEGLQISAEKILGRSGDYEKEPHFDAGVWRYCAAHVGGAEALIDHSLAAMAKHNYLEDPLQLRRIGRAISTCRAGASLVREWSVRVECAGKTGRDSSDEAMAGALLARTFVENMAISVLQDCERCLGTSAHMPESNVERLRRDLSLYIRQASPDAKLVKAAKTLCSPHREPRNLW